NVAGLGEALRAAQETLPTFRAHNEQGMAHAAAAFAKASRRRRAMICTSSIGPGALNMVTAAAVAHVNRLPVLFLPGDVFAGRGPDPVLQQVEDFADGTVSANDCFRPVSRYFDRIQRPEQLVDALPRAMATLLDPAGCGPVTLAFCQDTQTEAWEFPARMLEPTRWSIRRPPPAAEDLRQAAALSAGGIRSRWAPSASRARAPRTLPRRQRMSCWRSVPGCRISRPPRGRCFPGAYDSCRRMSTRMTRTNMGPWQSSVMPARCSSGCGRRSQAIASHTHGVTRSRRRAPPGKQHGVVQFIRRPLEVCPPTQ